MSSPYVASNPGEQFFLFTAIASWLINVAGRPFPAPQDDDEPYATVSNILAELRAFVSTAPAAVLYSILFKQYISTVYSKTWLWVMETRGCKSSLGLITLLIMCVCVCVCVSVCLCVSRG